MNINYICAYDKLRKGERSSSTAQQQFKRSQLFVHFAAHRKGLKPGSMH